MGMWSPWQQYHGRGNEQITRGERAAPQWLGMIQVAVSFTQGDPDPDHRDLPLPAFVGPALILPLARSHQVARRRRRIGCRLRGLPRAPCCVFRSVLLQAREEERSAKQNGSNCLLEKWAVTSFWFCRQDVSSAPIICRDRLVYSATTFHWSCK